MNAEDIKVGHVYRAKKPQRVMLFPEEFVNDRSVVYVGPMSVQYDSPSISMGRHYPTVPKERFLKWADRDVTAEVPKGEWMEWDAYRKQPMTK